MMKTQVLHSGDQMPMLGLGTWQSTSEQLSLALDTAIQAGYRHIDCSPIYGNEKAIGQTLCHQVKTGKITRESLWVTSKLWNSFHHPEDVEPALKKTLHDLQLEYLDLYLIHWPLAFAPHIGLGHPETAQDILPLDAIPLTDTWQALEAVVDKGLVRNIGLSNFSRKRIEPLLHTAKHKPAVLQVECHPYFNQNDLLQFCQQQHIAFTAYSPLGSNNRPAFTQLDNHPEPPIHNADIAKLAAKYHSTPAQIILAWQIQRGVIVIPKSANPERIQENFNALNVTLSQDDMNVMTDLNQNLRLFDATFWEVPGNTFRGANLWD